VTQKSICILNSENVPVASMVFEEKTETMIWNGREFGLSNDSRNDTAKNGTILAVIETEENSEIEKLSIYENNELIKQINLNYTNRSQHQIRNLELSADGKYAAMGGFIVYLHVLA